jgi:hypothetical protein
MSDINNTGGGNITGIEWVQLAPDITIPGTDVFSNDTDGSHNYLS